MIRRYTDQPVDPALLETLCAVALSAPSKSDLQQADIVIAGKAERGKLEALLPDNPWVKDAGALLVFCGNNRRHRLLFEWRDRPFVNDYLDPFFNAAVDSGIVLATFVAAADRVGLGTCPISAIRNVMRTLRTRSRVTTSIYVNRVPRGYRFGRLRPD